MSPTRTLLLGLLVCLVSLPGCTRNASTPPPSPPPAPGPAAATPSPDSPGDPPPAPAPVAAEPPASPPSGKSPVFPRAPGLHTVSLSVHGADRRVEIYLPESDIAGDPLFVLFHGTNDEAKRTIESSAARALADAEGLAVVAPQARTLPTGDWDNHEGREAYWQTVPEPDARTNADLALVQAIIVEAAATWRIDRRRIYLLGHSNGGFFALLAAMTLRSQIAGFVANSAGLVRCARTSGCRFTGKGRTCEALEKEPGYCACSEADKPLSLPTGEPRMPGFLAHAVDDKVVSPAYTCTLAARMKALGHPVKVHLWGPGGHGMPYPLAQMAWEFLSSYRR